MAGKREGQAGVGLNTELLLGTDLGCWERSIGTKPALGLCLSELLPEMGNLKQESYKINVISETSHPLLT